MMVVKKLTDTDKRTQIFVGGQYILNLLLIFFWEERNPRRKKTEREKRRK